MSTAWRNGYLPGKNWGGASILYGLTSKCPCCGKDKGSATGEVIGDPPQEPDWPFEQGDCPLCNMVEAIRSTPGTSLLDVLANHPEMKSD